MQLKLPFFPTDARLISDCVGVHEKDGVVQYIVNGLPVYTHTTDNIQAFRFITSNFIDQGLCRSVDVKRCFGVTEASVYRYLKKYRKQGEAGFFGVDARKGKAHKIVGERRRRIQAKLDKGISNYQIAKEEGVGESAIRYQIKQGLLKKKNLNL